MNNIDTVRITVKRYEELIDAERELLALIASGAANKPKLSDSMLPNYLLQDDSV